MSGPVVTKATSDQDGKNILCKTENFVSLVSWDFRHVPAQAHLRHRRRRIHRIHWIQQIHEVRREQRETACRIFRSGWRTSQKISKTQKCQHPQNISRDSDSERPINMAPRKRSIYTHFPKDQIAKSASESRCTRALCRRRIGESVHGQKFGDLITADHKVLNEVCDSRNNHLYSVVVQDLQLLNGFSRTRAKQKTTQETERSLRKFLEPSEKPKVIYTDNSLDFGKSCEDSSWNHRTSTHLGLLREQYAE